MAKMFYTMEEAKAALGRTEDEIKVLAREGKLREFRDGPRLMFKADQVESLKGTLGPKDLVDINDTGAPISLVDSASGGTGGGSASLGLADSAAPASKGGTGSQIALEGSFGGVPSPRAGGSGTGMNMGSRSGSGTGMNIFNPDDEADPSAATAITPASESGGLEVIGSGSGLLDLTRESDDTSLGNVLDDIGGKRDKGGTAAALGGTGIGTPASIASATPAPAMTRQSPVLIARPDPLAPFFGGLALGGAILCLFAIFVVASAVMGAQVTFLKDLATKGLFIVAAIGLVVSLIFGAIGFGLGKVLK